MIKAKNVANIITDWGIRRVAQGEYQADDFPVYLDFAQPVNVHEWDDLEMNTEYKVVFDGEDKA